MGSYAASHRNRSAESRIDALEQRLQDLSSLLQANSLGSQAPAEQQLRRCERKLKELEHRFTEAHQVRTGTRVANASVCLHPYPRAAEHPTATAGVQRALSVLAYAGEPLRPPAQREPASTAWPAPAERAKPAGTPADGSSQHQFTHRPSNRDRDTPRSSRGSAEVGQTRYWLAMLTRSLVAVLRLHPCWAPAAAHVVRALGADMCLCRQYQEQLATCSDAASHSQRVAVSSASKLQHLEEVLTRGLAEVQTLVASTQAQHQDDRRQNTKSGVDIAAAQDTHTHIDQ